MLDYNRLVRAYINMREARRDLKREFEQRDADLKEKMSRIEAALIAGLSETGADSVRTNSGTVFITEVSKASVADWSALADWIVQNNAVEFLEQRVKSTAVSEYLEQTGELPPGVNLHRERVVRVRKS